MIEVKLQCGGFHTWTAEVSEIAKGEFPALPTESHRISVSAKERCPQCNSIAYRAWVVYGPVEEGSIEVTLSFECEHGLLSKMCSICGEGEI